MFQVLEKGMNENEVGDKANELTNPIFIPIKEDNVTYSQSQKRRS